jgi:hypothetical protein
MANSCSGCVNKHKIFYVLLRSCHNCWVFELFYCSDGNPVCSINIVMSNAVSSHSHSQLAVTCFECECFCVGNEY